MKRRMRTAGWLIAAAAAAASIATTAIAAETPGSGSGSGSSAGSGSGSAMGGGSGSGSGSGSAMGSGAGSGVGSGSAMGSGAGGGSGSGAGGGSGSAAPPPPPPPSGPSTPAPPMTPDGRPFRPITSTPRPGWNQGNIVNACRNTPGLPQLPPDLCLVFYSNAGVPIAEQINIGHIIPWNQFVTQAQLMGYYQNPDLPANTYYQAAANTVPPGAPNSSQNPGSGLNNTYLQPALENQAAGALYDGPSINNPAVLDTINQQVALGNGTFGPPYGPLVDYLNQTITANPGMDFYIVQTEQGPMVFNDLGQPAEYNFQPQPWWNPQVPGSLGFVVPAQMLTGTVAQELWGTAGSVGNNLAWGTGTGYYYFGGMTGAAAGGVVALGATGGGIGGSYVGGQIDLALGGDGSIGQPIGGIAGAGAGAGLTAGVVYGTGLSTLGFAAGTTTGTVIVSTGGTVILVAGAAYAGYTVGTALAPYTTVPVADAYIDFMYGAQNNFNATGLPPPTGNEQYGPQAAGQVGACGTSYQQALCSQNCTSFGQSSSNCRCCTACQSYACGM